MGNGGAFRYCIPDDRKEFEKDNTVNFRSKSPNKMRRFSIERSKGGLHSNNNNISEDEKLFASNMLHSACRTFLSMKKLKVMKEVREKFENEFLRKISENLDK